MAINGIGAQLRRWNTSTGAWVAFAEVTNITGPGMSRGTNDTTALDTTGGYKTFIGRFRDGGTVSLDMNFTRTAYEQMLTDFEDEDAQNYEITLPDDDKTSIEFEGLVTELPLTIPAEGVVTVNVTIKISGKPSMDSGSGS